MADPVSVVSESVSSVVSAAASVATEAAATATGAISSVPTFSVNEFVNAFDFQTPSFDRPFGLYLWDVFAYIVPIISRGKFDPNTFEFVQGQVPFSTNLPVAAIIIAYYVIVFGGREVLSATGLGPYKFGLLFKIHNLFLTILSATLLALLVEQVLPILYHEGLFYAICNDDSWTQPIVVVYYLNYLTKFVEFIDTVFLMVRKKPLTFLHTYHHGATALLCYTQLLGNTSVSWVPIGINLLVHVVMYWYYFQSSRGVRVWWKQWVTRGQIIQFVIDICFIYFGTYTYYAYKYFRNILPTYGTCAGEEFAATIGCVIITSYLFLFIAFYIRIYSKSSAKKRAVKAEKSAAAAAAALATATTSGASTATTTKSRKA